MVCEPTMKNIALMDVQRDGAGYVAKDAFNLVASSDEWMSPVFAEVGPDGAVWFSDWQNYIIQHNPTPSIERGGYAAKTGVGGAHENPLRDHARGRIYRVVWDQAQQPASDQVAPRRDTTEQLVEALGDDTQFWRLTAQRLLVEGKTHRRRRRAQEAVAARRPHRRIHALWTLHGLGQLDDATHRAALLTPTTRRSAATPSARWDATQRAVAIYFGSAVMSDPDPLTRSPLS